MIFYIENISIRPTSVSVKLLPKDPQILTISHLRINISKHFYSFDLKTGMEVEVNLEDHLKIKRYEPKKN